MSQPVRKLLLFFALMIMATGGYCRNGSADSTDTEKLMKIIVAQQQELIIIEWKNLNTQDLQLSLIDTKGIVVQHTSLNSGSTIAYFDTQTLYAGEYVVEVSNGKESITHKITLTK